MKREELREKVVEALQEMQANQVVYIWNEVTSYGDYWVNFMEDFNDLFYGKKPLEVAEMLEYGDFNSGDDYFAFDGCGNIESFNDLDEYSMFSYYELADNLIENEDVMNEDYGLEKFLDDDVIEALENEEVEE